LVSPFNFFVVCILSVPFKEPPLTLITMVIVGVF
jgi:hypothetical protein